MNLALHLGHHDALVFAQAGATIGFTGLCVGLLSTWANLRRRLRAGQQPNKQQPNKQEDPRETRK